MKPAFSLYYNSNILLHIFYVAYIARRRNNANAVIATVTWIGSPMHSLSNHDKRMAKFCLFPEMRRRGSRGWQVLSDTTWRSSKSSSVKRAGTNSLSQCDYRRWVTLANCIVLLFALQKVLIISPLQHTGWRLLIDCPKPLAWSIWTF